MPQGFLFRDEEQAKKRTKTYGKYYDGHTYRRAEYYDLSSTEGKEAFTDNVIIGQYSHSWPPGILEKFEELKSGK